MKNLSVLILSCIILIGCNDNNSKHIEVLKTIKTVSTKEPICYTTYNSGDMILYLISEQNEVGQSSVSLNVLENIDRRWVRINEHKLVVENGSLNIVEDTIQKINIGADDYFFFVADEYFSGTANNGLTSNRFIFYNAEKDSLIDISYSIWAGEATGQFKTQNGKVNEHKDFLSYLTPFIEKKYGKQNLNIDDEENFHLKWVAENKDIYNRTANYKSDGSWLDIKVVTFKRDFFFSMMEEFRYNVEVKHSPKYLVSAGFCSPVLVYSKLKDEAYVLWIPEDWPKGGAWGLRSFRVDSIEEDFITISDSFLKLEFHIASKKFRVIEKKD
ncbi:MAG: hypothetical protein JNK27_01325 [Chitinophagaceae bacterium]|nr:hypothetical protein [Chitinophagaceae bacterium]